MNYIPATFDVTKLRFGEGAYFKVAGQKNPGYVVTPFVSDRTKWQGRPNAAALDVRNRITEQERIALAKIETALTFKMRKTSGSFAHLTVNRDLTADATRIWRTLKQAEKTARSTSSATANTELRKNIKLGRPETTSRPGRTSKDMAKKLEWVQGGTKQAAVGLSKKANDAWYWKVQEIGTGETATMRHGKPKKIGPGRPAKSIADPRISVPSQRGRMIKFGLQFGDGPNGNYFRPSRRRGQQLQPLENLKVRPWQWAYMRPVQIHREIPAQHMVRDSGKAGFREYRKLVLAASRGAFPATG